ncbi:MAG: hypothetical protein PHN45_08800 [Methylococcales bacterium]|nr:hypothetical protein [Methylococcales bacterium]
MMNRYTSEPNNDVPLPPHANVMESLNTKQMEFVLQMKHEDYLKTVRTVRYLCDDEIQTKLCKGTMPVFFKIPLKMVNPEFNLQKLVTDVAATLERDGFYVQQDQKKCNVLLIYPRCAAACTFLNIPEKAQTFIRQIQSVESAKQRSQQQTPGLRPTNNGFL